MIRSAALLAVLCCATALPVAAQEAEPATGEIVVTGKTPTPPTKAETFDQALEVSRIDPHQTYEEALPRFAAPLCPGVFGLREDYAGEIVARIRANGDRLKVKLARRGCSPNLLVAFLDDGRSFLDSLARKQPGMFRQVADAERAELLKQPAPVRVWTNISVRWTGAGAPPAGWPKQRPSVWGQLSRSALPEARDIQSALVVYDRAAVVGMTLTQLADYATMRGLSHTRPADGDQPMATILALFADGTHQPDALTRFDQGYLQSLYFEAANQPAISKLLGIRRKVAK